jgi:hypothetical protein
MSARSELPRAGRRREDVASGHPDTAPAPGKGQGGRGGLPRGAPARSEQGWAASGLLRAAEAQGDAADIEEARALMRRNGLGGGAPDLDRL